MKKILFTASILFFGICSTDAQSIFDKIDQIANKVDNATSKIDKAANTADRTSKTGGKLLSLVSKKKSGSSEVSENNASETKTQITLLNSDMAKAKKLNEILESSKNVSSSQMKFSAGKAVFTVMHSGSTDKLLNSIQGKSKDIFTDSNIQDFEDGKITIKL